MSQEFTIEELKEKSQKAFEAVEEHSSLFAKKLSNLKSSTLPDGFEYSFKIKGKNVAHKEASSELRIWLNESNTGGESPQSKYFWTLDKSTTLNFRGDSFAGCQSDIVSGGYNTNEYNHGDNPPIDHIEMHELISDINKSSINLMKTAKETPELFTKFIKEYTSLNAVLGHLDTEIRLKESSEKAIRRENDLNAVNASFTTMDNGSVGSLFEKMKASASIETVVPFIRLELPTVVYQDQCTLREFELRQTKGDRISLMVGSSDEGFKRISEKSARELLGESLFIDGNNVESVKEIVDSIGNMKLSNIMEDSTRNRSQKLSVPLDLVVSISKGVGTNLFQDIGNLDQLVKDKFSAPKVDSGSKNTLKK